MVHIWRSENNLQESPLYTVGPRDHTQVIGLGSQQFSQLSHLVTPSPPRNGHRVHSNLSRL